MTFGNTAALVHAAVAAVCPIHGVSIGRKDDKGTWRIDFQASATDEQRQAAMLAISALDLAVERAKPKPKTREEILEERLAALEAKLATR